MMGEKYIRVSDIDKVCDPWKDHDVHRYTAEEIVKNADAIPIGFIKWQILQLEGSDDVLVNLSRVILEALLERWRQHNVKDS